MIVPWEERSICGNQIIDDWYIIIDGKVKNKYSSIGYIIVNIGRFPEFIFKDDEDHESES
jgi:hypothetical protein